eukprot:9360236-Heterocapsa_arctica.AAC.1
MPSQPVTVTCELLLHVRPQPRLLARAPHDVEVVRDADALQSRAASQLGLAERLVEVQAEGDLREPAPLPSAPAGRIHSPLAALHALPRMDRPRPLADHHRDERRSNLPRRPDRRRPEHPAER